MRTSSGNSATVPEPSIWPLMPTPTAAASRRRNALPAGSASNGITCAPVSLPDGHDPNSFFVEGGDARQFQALLEAARSMTFRVVHKPSNSHARSPFRVVEQATGREVDWINQYLDHEMLRRLADTTLRSYAHELLHFLRWWEGVHHTDAIAKDALTESTLLDYVRFQSGQERELTGATINQRVAIVERALRIMFPDAPHQVAPGFQHDLLAASADGHRQTTAGLEPVAGEDAQTHHGARCRSMRWRDFGPAFAPRATWPSWD